VNAQPDDRTCRTCRQGRSVTGGKHGARWFRLCERERPVRIVREEETCEHYEEHRQADYSGGYHAAEAAEEALA